jgi:hypothetical protein
MKRRDFFKFFVPGSQPLRPAPPPNHFSLADLTELPDEQFLYLVPTFRAGLEISIRDRRLDARADGSGVLIAGLQLTDLEERAARSIDGVHNIRRITLTVGKAADVPLFEVYSAVRDLFLRLARQGLAHPTEPPRSIVGARRNS